MSTIQVYDPSFPQVSYDLPLEEVIQIIEFDDPNYPQWWKLFYKSLILDRMLDNATTTDL
jgi:hypothetical protein